MNLPDKRRRLNGLIEPLSSPVQHRDLDLTNFDAKVKRATPTKGWRCPYCGVKLLHKQYYDEFTLEMHLKQSPDCRKQHERNQD